MLYRETEHVQSVRAKGGSEQVPCQSYRCPVIQTMCQRWSPKWLPGSLHHLQSVSHKTSSMIQRSQAISLTFSIGNFVFLSKTQSSISTSVRWTKTNSALTTSPTRLFLPSLQTQPCPLTRLLFFQSNEQSPAHASDTN